jgi:hypothetical protein
VLCIRSGGVGASSSGVGKKKGKGSGNGSDVDHCSDVDCGGGSNSNHYSNELHRVHSHHPLSTSFAATVAASSTIAIALPPQPQTLWASGHCCPWHIHHSHHPQHTLHCNCPWHSHGCCCHQQTCG